MTPCLRPDEFVDLVDGTLPPERRKHLDGCAACRTTAAEIRDTLAVAASDEVPEPSTLFWPSINARVMAQLGERPGSTWRAWLRWQRLAPAAAVTAVAVAIVVSIGRVSPDQPTAPVPTAAGTATGPGDVIAPDPDVADIDAGDAALALVVDLSQDLPDGGWDTLGITSLPDLAEAAAVLSSEEQEALTALLRSAMDRPKS